MSTYSGCGHEAPVYDDPFSESESPPDGTVLAGKCYPCSITAVQETIIRFAAQVALHGAHPVATQLAYRLSPLELEALRTAAKVLEQADEE